jgi:hypothetical protein
MGVASRSAHCYVTPPTSNSVRTQRSPTFRTCQVDWNRIAYASPNRRCRVPGRASPIRTLVNLVSSVHSIDGRYSGHVPGLLPVV